MFTCSQNHFNALVGFSNLELIFRSALWDLQCKKKKKEKKKKKKNYYYLLTRTVEAEMKMNHRWGTIQRLASD